MKQLSLELGYTETTPKMTAGDREKFEAIQAISPDDIMIVCQEKPEPDFHPHPEWEGQWFRTFWVQWNPLLTVLHPDSGYLIVFDGDDSDLNPVADDIAEILK
ncbi:MAG: hypothetical protein F6K24_03080 [Okeania sp. SIO2D1]|nr:hypothetical protein [Okeania sp. SIO2D1]